VQTTPVAGSPWFNIGSMIALHSLSMKVVAGRGETSLCNITLQRAKHCINMPKVGLLHPLLPGYCH